MVLYDDLLKDEDYSGELRPDVEAALTKEQTEVLQIFTSTNLKSGIRIFPSRIQGVKKISDPGSGSA
jgi:hypothetical protein